MVRPSAPELHWWLLQSSLVSGTVKHWAVWGSSFLFKAQGLWVTTREALHSPAHRGHWSLEAHVSTEPPHLSLLQRAQLLITSDHTQVTLSLSTQTAECFTPLALNWAAENLPSAAWGGSRWGSDRGQVQLTPHGSTWGLKRNKYLKKHCWISHVSFGVLSHSLLFQT